MSDSYTDSKINLVINKLNKALYDKLVLSNLIDEQLLYMVDGDGVTNEVRYALLNLTPELSTITVEGTLIQALTCQAYDMSINTISTDTSAYPIYVYMPPIPDGCLGRDFCVRIECLSSSIPAVAFLGSGTESCDFESEDDDWATLEVGVNLFNFTETKR